MLRSRYRRAGAPVLLAFGTTREPQSLRVGLLFVSAQLDPREYVLYDVDTDEEVTVRLSPGLIELSQDEFRTNTTLEVV